MKIPFPIYLTSVKALLALSFAGLPWLTPRCLADGRPLMTFPHREILPVSSPYDSQVADLNGDGNLDLAVLPDSGLFIFLGDGTGNFSTPMVYNQQGFQSVLALGDFNGDGFPDAAVANFPGINVLLNDGAGGFPTSLFINTGGEPAGLAVADFDGDGNLDLAVSDFQSNSVSILMGDGSGGFATPLICATGTNPTRIVAGDFDSDGIPDLAVAEYGSMDLRIYTGNGDGHFSPFAVHPLGGNAEGLVMADFNTDGKADLAVEVFNIYPNNHVAVFRGNGHGRFAQSASLPADVFQGIAAADINNDGKTDLAYLNGATPRNTLDVALGDGIGGFHHIRRITLPNSGQQNYTISTGDFDGDGRVDLFTDSIVLFNTP